MAKINKKTIQRLNDNGFIVTSQDIKKEKNGKFEIKAMNFNFEKMLKNSILSDCLIMHCVSLETLSDRINKGVYSFSLFDNSIIVKSTSIHPWDRDIAQDVMYVINKHLNNLLRGK